MRHPGTLIEAIEAHLAAHPLAADSADGVARWSTDPRSRVPALPRLDPSDPLPRCRQTVHRGVVLHG